MKRLLAIVMLFGLVVIVLVSFSKAAHSEYREKFIIGHGDLKGFLEKGCIQRHLDLRTAFALACPEDADLSGLEAYEDVRIYAFDLRADNQIRATLVWPNYTGVGRGTTVLDSGINYNHPELSSSYLGGFDFVNNDDDPSDDNGHGTHVAGIITADGIDPNAIGVAPSAGIFAGKVLDASGSGSLSTLIAAIYWAADNTTADVISISLGTAQVWKKSNCDSAYPDLTDAINYASSRGKTVVAASGNNPGGVSLPGCISSTVVVGAVDSRDRIASFSGRGFSMKDHGVVAPGVRIYSTWLGNGYRSLSGTSMSTPMVSGVIALMKEKNPDLSVERVKNILFTTSKDLGTAGCDTTYGCGRVDAFDAVNAS